MCMHAAGVGGYSPVTEHGVGASSAVWEPRKLASGQTSRTSNAWGRPAHHEAGRLSHAACDALSESYANRAADAQPGRELNCAQPHAFCAMHRSTRQCGTVHRHASVVGVNIADIGCSLLLQDPEVSPAARLNPARGKESDFPVAQAAQQSTGIDATPPCDLG